MHGVAGADRAVRPYRAAVLGWSLVVLLAAAYGGIFATQAAFSLQDYPNHLARALAIADLLFHGGERFGAWYQFHFAAVPYVLGDLLLSAAIELIGLRGATVAWIGLVVLSLPVALLIYLRAIKMPQPAQMLILILSLYLSTDAFLFMGFLSFRLAIALTLIALALVHRLRREWSGALFGAYCALVVLGYLMHLATLVFFVMAIGTSAALRLWLRSSSVRREVYFLAPPVFVALWHVALGTRGHAAGDLAQNHFQWGSWYFKARHLQWDFMRFYATRFDGRLEKLLLLGFLISALLPLRRRLSRSAFMEPAVLEMLLLSAAFFLMYVALPSTFGDASYLDLRPLALLPIFFLVTCAYLYENAPNPSARGQVAIALAALLASANLAHLSVHLASDNAWIARYRAIVAAIPAGAWVLPMYPGTDALLPFMHAASFAVIDRRAAIPYLFSGNRGNPQTYFRYLYLPYAPPASWYYWGDQSPSRVDWRAVACSYDYLLVMKPFDLQRIGLKTERVIDNSSAALLAVAKRACGRS